MENAMTNRLHDRFCLVYQTQRTRGGVMRKESTMHVVADCRVQFLLWLIVVCDLKGHSWPDRTFAIQKGSRVPKGYLRHERSFVDQKGILARKGFLVLKRHLGPKRYIQPKRAFVDRKGIISRKGIIGSKGYSRPKWHSRLKREFLARKGIISRKVIIGSKGCSRPKWHSRLKREFLARKGTRGSKGHLSSIISMMVSERWPLMWLELFVWRLPLMTCVVKDTRNDHPPTVYVCLFDGMKVTITNIFIIITPAQLIILFYHVIKCTFSCGSSTAR